MLVQKNTELILKAYVDVDYVQATMDRRSTIGYCIFFGGNFVTWKSKKQNVAERSNAKSEFRAMTQKIYITVMVKLA